MRKNGRRLGRSNDLALSLFCGARAADSVGEPTDPGCPDGNYRLASVAFFVAVPVLVLSWLSMRRTEREKQAELEAKEADWQRYRNEVLERKETPAEPGRMYERY